MNAPLVEPPRDVAEARRAGGFLGVATDPDSRRAIAMAAAARGWDHPEVREGGVETAQALIAAGMVPDVLVIDLSLERAPLPAIDALADVCPAGVGVVAIGTQNDVGLFRGLLALGVADYLLKPVDAETLGAAIDRLATAGPAPAVRPVMPVGRARTVAFAGVRGGAGASALAAATAAVLARQGRKVAVVDLDLQGGSLALDLGVEPTPGLVPLLERPDRVDPVVVGQALKSHRAGFHVLAVDAPAEAVLGVEADALLALVRAVAETVDLVVLDCPRWLDRARRAVLRTVDALAVVAPPTLPGLRDMGRVAGLARSLRAGQAPVLVVNRAGAFLAELERATFEEALGRRVDHWVPEDAPASRRAAERAETLAAGAASPLGAALRRLADQLGPPAAATPTSGTNPSRWWNGWRTRLAALVAGRP
ncbi:MAG: P-loop NTPase [Sphingomonadaceae bacterium]|uniref:AAA family ATPase n=1 Tax=Thermaurantiacus sp. TaxID=2820283 RepID=UPI00298EE3A6|nr:P-loop NTPase [Thermaurantiacus sp.]MCS6987737.1 P-loop NTPase [Sphingomonadaceae bacterium]MDW8415043.1 P-loop NTPase [Thermaurantiacus sp.]